MEITEDLIHMLRTLETDAKLKEMGFSEEEINQGREIVKNLNIEGSESLQHAQSLIQRMEDMDKRAAEARSKI